MIIGQSSKALANEASANVIGVGARTSLGGNLASSAAAARAGISNFAEHPYMIDGSGRPIVVARDCGLAIEVDGGKRLAEFAAAAAADSFSGVLPEASGRRLPVMLFLALREADRVCQSWSPSLIVDAVEETLGNSAQIDGVYNAAFGHVAGIEAVRAAHRVLGDGFDGCCLVLGVDSWLDALSLEWLDDTGQLHCSVRPFGFVPGEAAAGVLIGSSRWSSMTRPRAVLHGCYIEAEADLSPETPRLGLALTRAARSALNGLHPFDGRDPVAGAVMVNLNGMPERADEVGYTLVRVREHLAPGCPMVSPAEWFGDVGAATVPLMVALRILGAEKGYANEDTAMFLAQSVGTARGAMLISHFEERTDR